MGLVETGRRKSIGALSSYPAEQELQKGCFQRSNRYHLAMCAYYHSMYLVVREQLGLWSSIALLLVTTLILRKTWYKPLCKEEARYNEEMKQVK